MTLAAFDETVGPAARSAPPPPEPAAAAIVSRPPAGAVPADRRKARPVPPPLLPRAYSCRCGRPVFFRNSECLACHTALGYEPFEARLVPLEPVGVEPSGEAPGAAPAGKASATGSPAPVEWQEVPTEATPAGPPRRFLRCANLATGAGCNWLVAVPPPGMAGGVAPVEAAVSTPTAEAGIGAGPVAPLCVCCRLTRTLPDLSQPDNVVWWNRIEMAKRRLVSSLIGLDLPVSPPGEDPKLGLVFDLLRSSPGEPKVITGHADGVITLDVEEADDAHREQRRTALGEPYRTLLGHLRHECGHYYWQRLVEPGPWLEPFRSLFGDERQDYSEALKRHYDQGAPPDWNQRFVSHYASSHPWEDWAETFAHYLHLRDTLDTARSFGLDGERVELSYERFGTEVLEGDDAPDGFLQLINSWMELTGVLNELSRSMGVHDFYPFVLSAPVVRKLHLVHRVVCDAPR